VQRRQHRNKERDKDDNFTTHKFVLFRLWAAQSLRAMRDAREKIFPPPVSFWLETTGQAHWVLKTVKHWNSFLLCKGGEK